MIRNALGARWEAAKELPLVWLSLALALAVVLVTLVWPGPSDLRIRLVGLALQLVGALTVGFDLARTVHDLTGEGLGARVSRLAKELVFGRQMGTISGGGLLPGGPARTQMRPRGIVVPNGSLSERLAILEAAVSALRNEVDEVSHRQSTQHAELARKLHEETEQRRAGDIALQMRLRSVATGNADLLVFGIVWLCVGLLLATLAPEIWKVVTGSGHEVLQAL